MLAADRIAHDGANSDSHAVLPCQRQVRFDNFTLFINHLLVCFVFEKYSLNPTMKLLRADKDFWLVLGRHRVHPSQLLGKLVFLLRNAA